MVNVIYRNGKYLIFVNGTLVAIPLRKAGISRVKKDLEKVKQKIMTLLVAIPLRKAGISSQSCILWIRNSNTK